MTSYNVTISLAQIAHHGIVNSTTTQSLCAVVQCLSPSTAYVWSVHACSTAGPGADTVPLLAVTRAAVAPPPPTTVRGQLVGPQTDQVNISWIPPDVDDPSQAVASYSVFIIPPNNTLPEPVVVSATSTWYVSEGLTLFEAYYFAVAADNAGGRSALVRSAPPCFPGTLPPPAPTDVRATGID